MTVLDGLFILLTFALYHILEKFQDIPP